MIEVEVNDNRFTAKVPNQYTIAVYKKFNELSFWKGVSGQTEECKIWEFKKDDINEFLKFCLENDIEVKIE